MNTEDFLDKLGKLGLFIADFILTHFIWILPLICLVCSKEPTKVNWALIILLSFLVTFIYCAWKKKYDEDNRENTNGESIPQKLSVIKSPKHITWL
jgi:hypothetical protein